jgi:hypothetical protein
MNPNQVTLITTSLNHMIQKNKKNTYIYIIYNLLQLVQSNEAQSVIFFYVIFELINLKLTYKLNTLT